MLHVSVRYIPSSRRATGIYAQNNTFFTRFLCTVTCVIGYKMHTALYSTVQCYVQCDCSDILYIVGAWLQILKGMIKNVYLQWVCVFLTLGLL